MQLMGDGVAVISTSLEATRNRDVLYKFRPDSDFYYLTHFPGAESRCGPFTRPRAGGIHTVLQGQRPRKEKNGMATGRE